MRLEFTAELSRRLGDVALGKEPADLIIKGARLLNVYTGEILKDQQVVIAGERIAYAGPEHGFPAGAQTKVIDVDGQTLVPGFIDGHVHMDSLLQVDEFIRLSLPGGTTTVITDCSVISNGMGLEGVLIFLDQLGNQPQRIFATAPVISFQWSDRGAGKKAISLAEMISLLDRPEVAGLGEMYWSNLLNDSFRDDLVRLIEAAITRDKTVEGHGAGARNQKLAALAAHGADSCHEPITAEEVRERLRLGLATMIREGSIRRELAAVIPPLAGMDLDLRRAILVSDGIWPHELAEYGHMDYIVQKAIDLGLDPVRAVQMATLNAAEHFHLDGDLGGIAPGKCADLVVIPDLKTIKAQLVICRGQIVAREGKLLAEPGTRAYPEKVCQNIKLAPVDAGFFRLPAGSPEAKVRVMEIVTDIVNRETALTLPVVDGAVDIAGEEDLLKASVIEQHGGSGQRSLGFLKGYGLRRGALACSISFDEGNLIVVGKEDRDMACAVNRIRELNGGLVYCCNGLVEDEIPLPVFGKMSTLSGPEAAARLGSFLKNLKAAGCRSENPLLTLLTITFTAIPALRLLSRGYWLSKESRVVDIFVDN
ncbi:MAG: adenine deaminase C-terminal domain-containing protein [Bacillota bacterium]